MSNFFKGTLYPSIRWNSLLFFTVVFIMGVVFGSLTVNSMAFVQKQDLFFYLEQFFASWSPGKEGAHWELLRDSYLNHFLQLSLIFILGLSVIGVPLVVLLLFLKGVYFGFSVGFLVHQMGWKGLGIAAATIAPHNIITTPIYIGSSWFVGMFALYLSRPIWSGQKLDSLRLDLRRYAVVYFTGVLVLLLSSLIEVFFSRSLLDLFM